MRTTSSMPPRDMPMSATPGLRPLNVIAAAAHGGVPQARIRRVLADIAQSLAPLHAQGGVHGGIAMSTIGLDASGKAHLLTPPLAPAADAENAVRINGYAAFEQYTDDPDWPCGPWTDVYALSAVAHAMILGAPPPSALDRCVKDTSAPLAGRDLGGYDHDFLQAVDTGLSMAHTARPGAMPAFCLAFGLPSLVAAETPTPDPEPPGAAVTEPAPENVTQRAPDAVVTPPAATSQGAAAAEAAAHLPPIAAPEHAKPARRLPLLALLGILAALSLAVYMWLQPDSSFRSGVNTPPPPPDRPVVADAPSDIPAPPALSELGRAGESSGGPASMAGSPGATVSPDTPVGGGEGSVSSTGNPDSPVGAEGVAAPSPTLSSEAQNETGANPAPEQDPESAVAAGVGGDTSLASTPETAPETATGTETNPEDAGAAVPETETTVDTVPEPVAEPPPPPPAQVAVGVSVRPWGEVIVNGRSRGISPPLGQIMLSPGKYNVTIRNPAAPDYNTTITVGAGGAASISHVFD